MAQPSARSTTSSASLPDFVTSPIAAGLIAAELLERADEVERQATEQGASRITAARVRMIRRAAKQLEAASAEDEGGE